MLDFLVKSLLTYFFIILGLGLTFNINVDANECIPIESKVPWEKVICISKNDVENLTSNYSFDVLKNTKKIMTVSSLYPPKMYEIINRGCKNWACTKKKAGQNVYKMFVERTERWHTKYPGDIIYAMSWFEILYLGKVKKKKKIINRYLNSTSDDYFNANVDKKKLKSLIKMNKGRLQMRSAIGLKKDDELSKVFQTQWVLGNYLNKDKREVKKNKIDPALKKRKILLMNYKSAIKRYKEKASEAK